MKIPISSLMKMELKFEKDYLNFYNKKNKEDNNTKDLDKIFEQRFAVENYKDIWM